MAGDSRNLRGSECYMPEVAIIAGEASGDASSAVLIRELLAHRPDLEIWGAGGDQMRNAGVHILTNLLMGGAIGIVQSLAVVPRIAGKYMQVRSAVLRRRPDLLILVDFGAFNVRIGQVARKAGIKTLYYFPPSSWRKSGRGTAGVKASSDRVITPFPWSEKILRDAGVDAWFVGHPLLDVVKPSLDKESFCKTAGIDPNARIVGILPGSRSHEITHNLPALIEAAAIISDEAPDIQYVIAAGPNGSSKKVRDVLRRYSSGISVVDGLTYDVMAHSDLLLSCSGTATLEAAIIGTPMVIFYRGNSIMRLEYLLRKAKVLELFIGMPNIMAGKSICPELVAGAATPKAIAQAAIEILKDEKRMRHMREELLGVKSMLGEPGSVSRAASLVLDTIG